MSTARVPTYAQLRVVPDETLITPAQRMVDYSEAALYDLQMRNVYLRYNPTLVGLAANQIGLPMSICVVLTPSGWLTLVNPVVVSTAGEMVIEEEGCGSVPGVRVGVARPEKVTVRYDNLTGEEIEVGFVGFTSRVVQHEIDHLNGVLITDKAVS